MPAKIGWGQETPQPSRFTQPSKLQLIVRGILTPDASSRAFLPGLSDSLPDEERAGIPAKSGRGQESPRSSKSSQPSGLILILLCLCLLLIPHSAFCTPHSKAAHKLIVVVANRTTLADLDNPAFPTLQKMIHKGSAALISPNCIGAKTEPSVMMTAASGVSCRADISIQEFYDSSEKTISGEHAGSAYSVRTGSRIPSGCVFLGIAQEQRLNKSMDQGPVMLGALGESLRLAGERTCTVGNADIPPLLVDRSAAVLAMDSNGHIDRGALSDFDGENLPAADFTVVNFGDTAVLDEGKMSISDAAYAARKAETIKKLDALLKNLEHSAEPGTRFVIVSLCPPAPGPWSRLTPLIVYPSAEPGLLTSPGTRTPGLIAASDFAPTILGIMRVKPVPQIVGRAATETPTKHGIDRLYAMDTVVYSRKILQVPMLWFFALVGAGTWAVVTVIIARSLKISKRLSFMLRVGMLTGAAACVAMLFAVAAPVGIIGYILGTAVALIVLVTFSLIIGARYAKGIRGVPVLVIYTVTVAALVVDSFSGGYLCKFSLPSAYQLSGLRFYGIGNEYAGAFIPMAALTALFLFRGNKWAVIGMGALVVGVLGMGNLGANYGGTVAAVITFVLLYFAVTKNRFGLRHIIGAFIFGIGLIAVFAVLDAKIAGPATSHAGRTVAFTSSMDNQYIASLAVRKVLLNIKFTFSHTALRAYLAFLPAVAVWIWGVQSKAKRMFGGDARITAGLKAVLYGVLAAYLFNDSGIVMASIMMVMIVLLLLYSLLEESVEAGKCPES